MSPAMLTLVAAVDVYDLAAEGATDAFELLSSPRVSRYAISWTSVEKDIMAMNLAVGSVSPYCQTPQTTKSPASRTREVFSNEIPNRVMARVQPFKGLEPQCQGRFVATLRWPVCLRQGLGKLSIAVTFGFVGIGCGSSSSSTICKIPKDSFRLNVQLSFGHDIYFDQLKFAYVCKTVIGCIYLGFKSNECMANNLAQMT
jgi:hypothetical protein